MASQSFQVFSGEWYKSSTNSSPRQVRRSNYACIIRRYKPRSIRIHQPHF